MKKENKIQQNKPAQDVEKMNRKEALKKGGKYAAFTAATMLLLLSSKDAPAASAVPATPGSDW